MDEELVPFDKETAHDHIYYARYIHSRPRFSGQSVGDGDRSSVISCKPRHIVQASGPPSAINTSLALAAAALPL